MYIYVSLFVKLHDSKNMECSASNFESRKARKVAERLKLFLCSLSAIMKEHEAIKSRHKFGFLWCLYSFWHYEFHNHHFPIFGQCFISILQHFYAIFIWPIVQNILQQTHIYSPINHMSSISITSHWNKINLYVYIYTYIHRVN